MNSRLSAFWVGLLLIVMIAALPRLLSYRFGLPYVDSPDEPNYYLAGLEWRGLYDNQGYYDSAPPTYIGFSAALQPALEAIGIRDLAPTVQLMRQLSVIVNLVTLIFIAMTARLAAGDLAGWVAGIAWGIAPLVLSEGIFALPDPYVYLGAALAYYLAAQGLKNPEQVWWSIASVVVALVAVAVKYTALPLLAPGFLVGIYLAARYRKFRPVLVQVLLIAGTGFWLVVIYGINFGKVPPEGSSGVIGLWAEVESSIIANLLNINRLWNNFYYGLYPLNILVFMVAIAGGGTALLLARRRRLSQIHLGVIGLGVVLLVTIPWLYNSFAEVDVSTIRYVLPATAAACVILGAAVAQIANVLPIRQPISRALIVLAPLILLVWLPQVSADRAIVQDRMQPDRRVALRQWFDSNLEPGTVLVDAENHKTFNPIWGGIPYRNWVDWWETDNVMEYPVAEWRDERGMSYAVIPKGQVEQMESNEAGQAYLGQMLHLRDFFGTRDTRGPEVAVYRLWRSQYEAEFQFGDSIRLVGYDQSAESIRPGDMLTLRFYWAADTTPPDNYSLFIHLVPADEYTVMAQADGAPASSERPTLTWNDPGETLISPIFSLAIPDSLASGDYRVMVGLYNYVDGARLLVEGSEGNSPGDALELARITVAE